LTKRVDQAEIRNDRRRQRIQFNGLFVAVDRSGKLTLGEPLQLGQETVTLVATEPGTRAGKPTDPRAYRFTFAYGRAN